jgi:sec-independent protein translocase protein TatB
MFNVGAGEMLVILLLALIVLGPDKLPNAARQAGKFMSEFRRMSDGFQRELRDAMDLNDIQTTTDANESNGGVPHASRVIETANGPTLAPLDVTTPEVAPTPASSERATPGSNGRGAPPTPIQVDGPSGSFS